MWWWLSRSGNAFMKGKGKGKAKDDISKSNANTSIALLLKENSLRQLRHWYRNCKKNMENNKKKACKISTSGIYLIKINLVALF
jgi:hypothetical protein